MQRWWTGGEVCSPWGITTHLYRPKGVVTAVRWMLSGSIVVWKKLSVISSLLHILPCPVSVRISLTRGKGWESVTVFVRATPSRIQKQVSCRLYKNSGLDEMRLMGWLWSDTIRNGKGAVGWDKHVSPNMVEYPKRTQLGCPLSLYYVYILCYIYCRVFDHATGTHAYRHVHNFVITCVRNIIPMIVLRAFGVASGLSWAEINKEK